MRPATVEIDIFWEITAATREDTKQRLLVYLPVPLFFPEYSRQPARLLLFYLLVIVAPNKAISPIIISVALEYLLPSRGKGGDILLGKGR